MVDAFAPAVTIKRLKVESADVPVGIVLMQSHASIPITIKTATAATND